ncbi:MAG: zinc-ribbon domain-containing protein [Patescibacteria group bacterium]|nr:zinc-ribbon domain-containing protein [Patescibacteria group bacterium]
MTPEQQICKECSIQFPIEADDIEFYEKFKVPAPVRCPDCRQRRRYAWRNERVLYRRNCDLCGKSAVTIYSPNKPFKVYCPPCFWSDKWTGFDYGHDFDFSKPFFPQWQELQLQVPRIALLTKNSVNSDYTNHSNNNKNCYLSMGTFDSENIMYSTNVLKPSKDCMDCYLMSFEAGAELAYECVDSLRIYNCQYSALLKDCTDCFYSYDLRGCSNCFLCWNLRNKQYCILNEQYSKEEYEKKIVEYRLGSARAREELYVQFREVIEARALRRFAVIERSAAVSGNSIINSKSCLHAFDAHKVEDSKYAIVCGDAKNTMDSYHYGYACELIYESHALIHDYDVKFTHLSYDNSHLEYCDSCHNSENLFGCVGIKQGKYSIFNKRYEESEYATLKEKIIAHMKETGEYGEFFPPTLSPFGYNETQGQVYMPMTKEEAAAKGYKWEEVIPGTFGKETLTPESIPDDIKDVPDIIVKEALACVRCKRNYNIVQAELDFYRRTNTPIPRLCPECRYRRRLTLRLPRKLWHRQCMCDYKIHENTAKHAHHPEGQCPNEFETPYVPERKEIVYCEACYNAEIV